MARVTFKETPVVVKQKTDYVLWDNGGVCTLYTDGDFIGIINGCGAKYVLEEKGINASPDAFGFYVTLSDLREIAAALNGFCDRKESE
jgi:hypothetical protein